MTVLFGCVDMNVIRVASPKDPFSRVPQVTLEDVTLSWKAKGILAYLAGRPAGWNIRVQDLVNRSTDGLESVYSGMKELRKAGYAKLRETRESGKFRSREWIVRVSPDLGFPGQGNPGHNKIDDSKNSLRSSSLSNKKDFAARAAKVSLGVNGETKEVILSKKFLEFATINRLLTGRNAPSIKTWTSSIKLLIKQLDCHPKRIARVMRWYFDHFRDEYVPKCYAVTTFCDKFLAIEDAMKRDLHEKDEVDIPVDRSEEVDAKVNFDW